MSSEPGKSMAQRFAQFCVLILVGVIAIWIAFDILSRVWGWLLLVAVLLALGYVGFVLFRRWRNRW